MWRVLKACKNCSSKCAYDCAQLQYTIQHRTVLIISPSYLQTNIIAQMLSIGGEGLTIILKCHMMSNAAVKYIAHRH